MAQSVEAFVSGLYIECIEESACLYDQRQDMIAETDCPPHALRRIEDRLDRIIEAIFLGGDIASQYALARAVKGDPGERYVCSRALARAQRAEAVVEALDALPEDDREAMVAVQTALYHELPGSLWPQIEPWVNRLSTSLVSLGIRLQGYHRFDSEGPLLVRLESALSDPTSFELLPALAWALGRLKTPQATQLLWRCLHDHLEQAGFEAALALLRCGERQTVAQQVSAWLLTR